MRARYVCSFVTVLLMLGFSASLATARTWHILPDGLGDAPTIQAGIDSAQAGDIVEVACGTYFEHDVAMKSGVILRSATESPNCVTVDAQQQGRVFVCENVAATASITGFTITGGSMPGTEDLGGGMLCTNARLTIAHCDFLANYSGWEGGGLACDGGAPVITHCRFVANEGYMGGGGIVCRDSDPDILHCWFEANVATDGAGLFCQTSSPRVEYGTFLNNDALVFGGAIFCHIEASPTFDHCTIVGNDAHLGGGIMTVYYSFPTMQNSIIAFSTDGSGINCYDELGHPTYLEISCSDVFENVGGGYTGWIEDQTGIHGNIAADPLFCDLDAGDLTVATTSSCLPDNNECNVVMGAFGEGCTITPAPESTPAAPLLGVAWPNPFNPHTSLVFTLPRAQHVHIAVLDLSGRRIKVLVDRYAPPGSHTISWDGRDDTGHPVPSGAYVVRMETTGQVQAHKITLLR